MTTAPGPNGTGVRCAKSTLNFQFHVLRLRRVLHLGCQNLRNCPNFSQTRASVPTSGGPSTWCVPNLGSALAAARGERNVQTRCSSRNAFELERYRTEQSLHRLRRVGGDPHECQSNSMNLSQRHAADAAPW